MAIQAKIKLVQGLSTPPAGEALLGVLTTPVVASNGNNTGVVLWVWEILDVPPGSAVPTGIVAIGASPTFTFNPDVRGGYLLRLTVRDSFNRTASDVRVFQVPETTGRYIVPFGATAPALNFSGQLRGWSPSIEAYLHQVDSGGGGGVPTSRQIIAGAGLTGGGNLTVDRTIDAVANADGSIVVNANDIQVGILATDAQHGNRGGGALHSVAVPSGAAGFLTGADKQKLDLLPTSPQTIFYGPADRAQYFTVNAPGDYSTGVQFLVLRPLNFTGIRFFAYWIGGGTKSVKVTLYNVTDAVQVAQTTQGSVASGTMYDVVLPTTLLNPVKTYIVYTYVTDGTFYYAYVSGSADPADPTGTTTNKLLAGPNFVIDKYRFSAGDAVPVTSSSSERYSVQPILVNP